MEILIGTRDSRFDGAEEFGSMGCTSVESVMGVAEVDG